MTKNVTFDGAVYDDSLQPAPPQFATLITAAEQTGKTGAVNPVLSFTTPNDSQKHLYLIVITVTVTTYSSGTFNPQATWTDDGATARTAQAIPVGTAGSAPTVSAIAAAGTFLGSMPIATNPNTTVTILTGGTFTSLTYNVSASVIFLR